METRNIYCENGCGKDLGTLELQDGTSEEIWQDRLSGYLWDHCAGNCDPLTCPHPDHGNQ